MSHQICIHTNDKLYNEKSIEQTEFSSQSWNESITHSTKINSNALNSRVWDDNDIIYWKRESSYEFIDDKTMDKMIKATVLESSYETPLIIRQRRKSTADAQIKINWLGAKDEKYFKDKSGVLAFAYGPGKGLGGDCTMNSDYLWLLRKKPLSMIEAFTKGYIDESRYDKAHPQNKIKFYDPLHTLKHEIGGHALGMRHITDTTKKYSSIMYPYYNGKRKFGVADLKYLHELYGNSNVPHKIREMLANRINLF